tara:strand:+ start:2219 stop:2950 length:732 start_codon:yes stop_codon:yes gene_type:complete
VNTSKAQMDFTEDDLTFFVKNIWTDVLSSNDGGMGAPDLFSLWFTLNKFQPKVVIESGVFNGISTKLIRNALPDCKIICLDPRNIPNSGYVDHNKNTVYHIGANFIDFKNLDISEYNPNDILCFFDCHQNAYIRLKQAIAKNITKLFFNDNYPKNCGSHFTLEHLKNNDERLYRVNPGEKESIEKLIKTYHIFPNIYPGKILTGEGYFECKSFYPTDNDIVSFKIFKQERNRYRWNTFIECSH